MEQQYTSLLELSGYGFLIHLVTIGDEQQYGLYVYSEEDDAGALMCLFDDKANLAMVLSFIMTLMNSEPTRGSAEVQAIVQQMQESEQGGEQV
jgi:hypothetical protein